MSELSSEKGPPLVNPRVAATLLHPWRPFRSTLLNARCSLSRFLRSAFLGRTPIFSLYKTMGFHCCLLRFLSRPYVRCSQSTYSKAKPTRSIGLCI